MAGKTNGMIFLEDANRIIEGNLQKKLLNIGKGDKSDPTKPMDPVDVQLADFDDVMYRISVLSESQNIMTISMRMAPGVVAEIMQQGGKELVDRDYAGMNIDAEPGFDLTFQFDVNSMPEKPEVLVNKFSNLKRNILGAPLDKCFRALRDGSSNSIKPFRLSYRSMEDMYIVPGSHAIHGDRIVVVYSIDCADLTDQAIMKVFLQEFAESGKRVNNAPPVSFSRDAPAELASFAGSIATHESLVGYVSFVIFKSHVETDQKFVKSISMLQGFRSYLLYHLKCSKSYLHSRMRLRVNLMLQILNRAKPAKDPDAVVANKKTISGKTFTRS